MKNPWIGNTIFRKKNKDGGITLLDFNLYYKYIVIKIVWSWHKNRHTSQCSRLESPEINRHKYGQLIYDKGATNIQWVKGSLFNTWCWENWKAPCRRMKLDHYLALYTKYNSKWTKDLNLRPKTINPLEENKQSTVDISLGNDFLDLTPKAKTTKANLNKWD